MAQQIHIHTLPMMEKQALPSLFQLQQELQGGRNDHPLGSEGSVRRAGGLTPEYTASTNQTSYFLRL